MKGPGSYTAIRVVAAVCKTLAYTLKIKLKKVSSLKLQALLEFDSNKLLVPFIDARRGKFLVQYMKYWWQLNRNIRRRVLLT